jgi:23S rRNA pseudouridine2605 synthase
MLVARRPSEEQLEIWRRGVVLEDGIRTSPMEVVVESPEGRGAWLRVVMHEGRKHELREIGRCIGLPVVRIIRRRIGSLTLGGLRPGQYRELTSAEIASLRGSGTISAPRKHSWKKRFPPDRSASRRIPAELASRAGPGTEPAKRRSADKKRFTPARNKGKHIPAEITTRRGEGAKPPSWKPAGKNRFTPYRKSGRRAPKG